MISKKVQILNEYFTYYTRLRSEGLVLQDRRLEILFVLFQHKRKWMDRVSISKMSQMSYQSALYELEKMVGEQIIITKKTSDIVISNTEFYALSEKTFKKLSSLFDE